MCLVFYDFDNASGSVVDVIWHGGIVVCCTSDEENV